MKIIKKYVLNIIRLVVKSKKVNIYICNMFKHFSQNFNQKDKIH